ncbi:hypothetical protein Bca101_012454 [Brassica carinata]
METEGSGMAMCLLTDAEGTPLGSAMYISRNAGQLQLTSLVNKFLNNEEKLSYTFYISDEELLVSVGTYMERNRGHKGDILCLSFSPDGKQLASGSGDKTVRLWDLNTETPMFTCTDAKCLVSGDKDGKICCWDPSKGELQGKALPGHKKWICGIAWEPAHLSYPSRRFVTCGKDGDARIWDFTQKRTLIVLSGHTKAVTCVKWGGDGTIYTGSEDSTIRMWVITRQGQGVLKHILTIALERYIKAKGKVDSPERLVSGSDDFTTILWEPSVSLQPKTKNGYWNQLVNHVYFSPNGQWIASASFDKSVKLWDGVTGKFITDFRGHAKSVYQISWSADSRMLLSCSADSTLKVWDISMKRLKHDLSGHTDEVYAVDWSRDGEKVASGGVDKVLRLWKG